MRRSFPISFLIILLLSTAAWTQNWPGKIAGYKLHDPKIVITNASSDAVVVKVEKATVKRVSLAGTMIEIEAEISARKSGADITFVTFKDIRINGIAVEPEEYRSPFSIKKGETRKLPAPVRVLIPAASHPKAVYEQLTNPTSRLKITGTVFVFGKFKRFGIGFKRVAPVRLDLEIDNPIRLL